LITDNIGTNIIIGKLAIFETSFYGAGNTGVYSLKPLGIWKQILDNIPDKVISISAKGDILFNGTYVYHDHIASRGLRFFLCGNTILIPRHCNDASVKNWNLKIL